jgi:hypothetical protein
MPNSDVFWIVTAALAFLSLLLLSRAVALEWAVLPPYWRPVMVVIVIQQGVIAYGCWEAFGSHVSVAARTFLNAAILACLAATVIYVLLVRRKAPRRKHQATSAGRT